MFAKVTIHNELSRDEDHIKQKEYLQRKIQGKSNNEDDTPPSQIGLSFAQKPQEFIRHETHKAYCNEAVLHVKVGDTFSLYPNPDNFFTTQLEDQPSFTVVKITKDKVILDIKNRKPGMNISNGETELGKLILNELESDRAELVIFAGLGYLEITDNDERLSQQLLILDIVEEEI